MNMPNAEDMDIGHSSLAGDRWPRPVDPIDECVRLNHQLTTLADANRKLTSQLAAMLNVIVQWKEFLQEVEAAEDRSNLDGDSAEVVLEQLNDGAAKMLELAPK